MNPLSWKELGTLAKRVSKDLINGPTNSQARLRLFGQSESSVKVTLYRDNHGWCPYCQKIWLWLEEKRVPYKVEKVTMFCYGEKESWYKDICPSGVLPSLKLNGNFIAESDTIITALEKQFGPLHAKMDDPRVRNYVSVIFYSEVPNCGRADRNKQAGLEKMPTCLLIF